MADLNSIMEAGIAQSINEIWQRYDTDGTGKLEKETVKQVMRDWLKLDNAEAEFEDADFELGFSEFDTDNLGTLEKGQMVQFVSKLCFGDDDY